MTDDSRDTVGMDPQKGRKPSATPAGVNRTDMAEEGPQMSQTPGANVGIEHNRPDALGEPGEAGGSDSPSVPGADDPEG